MLSELQANIQPQTFQVLLNMMDLKGKMNVELMGRWHTGHKTGSESAGQ